MNTDKIADKVESLKEKIEALKYNFSDDYREDANAEIQNAIEALDRWMEILDEDNDLKEEKEEEE